MDARRLRPVLVLSLVLSLVPAVGAAAAEEHFLSPSGSDSGSGSKSEPWATFDHALSQLRPGDVLTVRGGTYEERVESPKLTPADPDHPIVVRAAAGETPVIKGLLWLKGMDYWRFDGINVTWGDGAPDEHMVKLTDGVGWTFQNAEVWGARSFAGILVATSGGSEPDNWRIAGNCIHDTVPTNGTNNDHLIYANSGHNGSGLIEGNLMFNATNGNGVKLGGSSASEGGASNVSVRYNTIVNTHQSVLTSWQSSNNSITGNILYGVSENYANIRAYQLEGSGNRASGNVGGGSDAMFMNDPGYQPVKDAGGNRWAVNPEFDSTGGCGGFHPTNPDAEAHGYTAVGTVADAGGTVDTASDGAFSDDDVSIFEDDIEKLAAAGITRGCDSGRFCPDEAVTRGQMAAFLARALGLDAGSDDGRFSDDNDSVFEGDIGRLAAAGITRGCGGSRFCPDDPVTRAQMAAFLVRALDLDETPDGDLFDDDDGSIFEGDIGRLAEAGITRGCNPPDNDRFCPGDPVTRGQMAAFLVRALDLG